MEKEDKKKLRQEWKEVFKFLPLISQIGFMVAGSIIIFLAIGFFLDNYFKTNPLFLIIFLIVGIFSGFYNVYVSVNKLCDKNIFKK
ncbi:MAG TPA: AtpZ/AtpI family protein [bacterium]|nr:AtpZ/AtpI family protein [bacterium]HOL47660.1 AtpZ/AtpI family protein [bacterium]HPQ18417.1 AtpZ/AtpI family protein [bacterium]